MDGDQNESKFADEHIDAVSNFGKRSKKSAWPKGKSICDLAI